MTILIVDDSPFSRSFTEAILIANGYRDTVLAESAVEAFECLKLHDLTVSIPPDIDLILMDIVMPEINGMDACRAIKTKNHLKDIPIIMVTANTEAKQIEQAFAAGAMDYITKPLNEVELLARVRSALRLKKEIDERKAYAQQLLNLMRQLEEVNAKLKCLCSIDGLTGVANRRHFDAALHKEWRRARRDKIPLSVILLDIDFFKSYNDTYGHLTGDDCIIQVAQTVSKVLERPGDLVARYGGEEFAVILPATDQQGGLIVAEKIRYAIEALKIPHSGSLYDNILTISVGLATSTYDKINIISDPQKLLEMADVALYRAKKAGRNNVAVSDVLLKL